MVNEKRDLVDASDKNNNISEIAITELLSNRLSRSSWDVDKHDKDRNPKTTSQAPQLKKASQMPKRNFTLQLIDKF